MARILGKSENKQPLAATHSGPGPGDFPLGSRESRAAARLLLNSLANTKRRIEIVSHIPRPGQDGTKPHVSDWNDFADGLMRIVYVPSGMTREAVLKLADRPKSNTSTPIPPIPSNGHKPQE